MARPPPPDARPEPKYVYSDDETTDEEEEEEVDESDGSGSDVEEGEYGGGADDAQSAAEVELGSDETWYGRTRVGLHGQVDPEHDPDRTDPLTLSEAFGSRILRDHLLIGAMESSLLDPFTPRQRGLVCLCTLVVTGLLTCTMVEQPDVSSELVVVGSTLAAFTVSIVLQHVYEEYQPRVRTVVPYLDERTGQYGLAKLSEAEGVANDIKEAAAEQKRKVTLEESRRRKRLQERARRRSCQVSMFTFVLLGATGGLGYLGYGAALRIVEAGEVEPVFWCVVLSLIGQFVFLHTLKVLLASMMAVMSDHRKRQKLERSRRVGMDSESAAEALAARLGKPQPPKKKPPTQSPQDSNAGDETQQHEDKDEAEDSEEDSQEEDQIIEERVKKKKPAPPPRRADQQARLQMAKTDAGTMHGQSQAHASNGLEADEHSRDVTRTPAVKQSVEASNSALALGVPTPSAAANALPPLSVPPALRGQQHAQEGMVSTETPIASRPAGGTTAGTLPAPSTAIQPAVTPATPATPAQQAPDPATPALASVPRPARAPASVPRPVRKAPANVPRPPRR
jgi:hypothetical protein